MLWVDSHVYILWVYIFWFLLQLAVVIVESLNKRFVEFKPNLLLFIKATTVSIRAKLALNLRRYLILNI